ncbi:hypothetical protein D3C76_1623720 [compost metagenome]
MASASGYNDRLMRRAIFQCAQYLFQRQIVVRHHISDFIQQDHIQRRIGQHPFGMFPHREAGRCIAFTVLRIPGKTGRHDLKLHTMRFQ